MNHGARERNGVPAGAIEAAGGQPVLRSGFEGGGEPLAIAADGALAQLGAGVAGDAALGEGVPVDGPQAVAAREDQGFAIGMERGGKRMDGFSAGDLAQGARIERGFEQLRRTGPVGGEEHLAAAGEERALQKVGGVADGAAFGHLQDVHAGGAVAKGDHRRPR